MKVSQYTQRDKDGMWDVFADHVVHYYAVLDPHAGFARLTRCGLEVGSYAGGWFPLAEGWDTDAVVNCRRCCDEP